MPGSSGRPKETTKNDVLVALSAHPEPVAKATEIAPELDVSDATVRNRLQELKDEGKVIQKEMGGMGSVWYPAEDADLSPEKLEEWKNAGSINWQRHGKLFAVSAIMLAVSFWLAVVFNSNSLILAFSGILILGGSVLLGYTIWEYFKDRASTGTPRQAILSNIE